MTGRYRTWFVAKWDREPFRSLPPLQRYLYLALSLGPYSTAIPGVSVCGPAAFAEAVGDVPEIHEHLDAMKGAGVVLQEGRLFVLPDVIAESLPINPNVSKAWRAAFDELPVGALKDSVNDTIRQLLIAHGQSQPVKSKDGRSDSFAYIRAWDGPTFDERSLNVSQTLAERPPDIPRTFPRAVRDVSRTLAEPETKTEAGTEPETESEPGTGTELGPGKQVKVKSVVPRRGKRGPEPASCFCGALIMRLEDGRAVNADDGTTVHDQAACAMREANAR